MITMTRCRFFSSALFISLFLIQMLLVNGNSPRVICRDAEGLRIENADVLARCHCHTHHDETCADHGHPLEPLSGEPLLTPGNCDRDCVDLVISEQGRKAEIAAYPLTLHPQPLPFTNKLPLSAFLATSVVKTAGESPPATRHDLHIFLSIWRC
jgi:hypothetical protein